MTANRAIRVALWISVGVNLAGALLFASGAIGRPSWLLALPIAPFYSAQLAFIIGLFGGVYAWLALQPTIDPPLLLVGAIGKIGFFALFVVYWAVGDLPWPTVTHASPDLMLGAIYLWWLRAHRPAERERSRAR